MSKRLFAFGCSATKYSKWITWADILGKQFDTYVNDAQPGAGNMFIFNKFMNRIETDKINKDDTVVIMWTNVMREDRFMNGKWETPGNIYTQGLYPEEWIRTYVDERGSFERDFPLIHAAQLILDKIGCKHHILAMTDITNPGQYVYKEPKQDISHLTTTFKDSLDRILPSIHRTVFNNDWETRPISTYLKRPDQHPMPLEHLEYLNKVLPEYEIAQATIDWVNNEQKKALMFLQRETSVDRFTGRQKKTYNFHG